MKEDRMFVRNFSKEPLTGTRSCFVVVAGKIFSPLRGSILEQHIIFCEIFSTQYPKRQHKASGCETL